MKQEHAALWKVKESLKRLERGIDEAAGSCAEAGGPFFSRVKLLLGFSGGRDSSALLHMLNTLKEEFGFELEALHIRHHIRKEDGEDEAFCTAQCERLGIPLHVEKVRAVSFAKESGRSLEDAARQLRREVFERISSEDSGEKTVWIALAHHKLDQAESVLLHLLRGSGLTGLLGMRERSEEDGCRYIRPLLEVSREEIDDYLEKNQISFVDDATNQDRQYTRNRIRMELIPALEKDYNPRIVSSIARMASLLQEEEDFLEREAEKAFLRAIEKPVDREGFSLKIPALTQESPAIQRRVIRLGLRKAGRLEDIESVHMDQILSLLVKPSGKKIALPGFLTALRSYDTICFQNLFPDGSASARSAQDAGVSEPHFAAEVRELFFMSEAECARIYSEGPPEKDLYMSAEEVSPELVWRKAQKEDFLFIRLSDGSLGKKKVRDLFSNAKVPAEEREKKLVLADGNHVLWIPGLRVCEKCRVNAGKGRFYHIESPGRCEHAAR